MNTNAPARSDDGRDLTTLLREVDALLANESIGRDLTAASGRLAAMVTQMTRDGIRREDPIREVLARLGDKWSPLLLHLLAQASLRHSTLRRLVSLLSAEGRISQRMLTLRLRTLERDGLVRREVLGTLPPGVRYELTPLGQSLVCHYEGLMAWARQNARDIERARSAFARTDRIRNVWDF